MYRLEAVITYVAQTYFGESVKGGIYTVERWRVLIAETIYIYII